MVAHARSCDFCWEIPFFDQRKQALLDGVNPNLASGDTLYRLAKRMDLSPTTLINWRNRYDDFPAGYADRMEGDMIYLQSQIQEFMQSRGLTGRRARKQRTGLNINEVFDSLCPLYALETRIALLLAVSSLMHERTGPVTADSVLNLLAKTAARLNGQVSLPHPDSLQQELQSWLQSSGYENLRDQSDHESIISWVRIRLRNETRPGIVNGSSSIGTLMSGLIPEDCAIFDMTPSSGFLLDAFRKKDNPITIVSPTAEMAMIAALSDEPDKRQVWVQDWMTGDRYLETIPNGSVVIGVAPTTTNQFQRRRPPSGSDWRRLPGCEKVSDVTDMFVMHVVAHLPSDGTAMIVVPAKWRSSPRHKAVRKALVRANLLDSILELPASLVAGNSHYAFLILSRSRRPGDSVKMIPKGQAEGTVIVQRMRDLSADDCDYLLDLFRQEAHQYVDQFEYEEPMLVSVSQIDKNDYQLDFDSYVFRNNTSFVHDETVTHADRQKDVSTRIARLVEQTDHVRSACAVLSSVAASISDSGEVSYHLLDGSSALCEVIFESKKNDDSWPDGVFRDDDVLVNLGASTRSDDSRLRYLDGASDSVARAVDGSHFGWTRIACIRTLDSSALVPDYLEVWAADVVNRLNNSLRGSYKARTHLSRKVLLAQQLPVPSLAQQKAIASSYSAIKGLRESIDEVVSRANSTESDVFELLFPYWETN